MSTVICYLCVVIVVCVLLWTFIVHMGVIETTFKGIYHYIYTDLHLTQCLKYTLNLYLFYIKVNILLTDAV